MSKEMLDILVDQKKVEEIAALPTKEEVEKKLKKEGVDVTSEDVEILGNIFDAASKKLDESELDKIGGGFSLKDIDWKSPKAKTAYKIIGGVVGTGVVLFGGYEADKHFNKGRVTDAIKAAPGKVKNWFSKPKDNEDGSL